MKKKYSFSKILVLLILIMSLAVFSNCTFKTSNTDNCNGYTGVVTNKNAAALQKICHFMSKDSIVAWTARYQKNKANINSIPPTAGAMLGDSCSFNNNIVKAFITNDSCIGLRVVYGMDEKNKIHVLLVGVKPDYTTLYIRKPLNCGNGNIASVDKNKNSDKVTGEEQIGGGEMGANP